MDITRGVDKPNHLRPESNCLWDRGWAVYIEYGISGVAFTPEITKLPSLSENHAAVIISGFTSEHGQS